ncbi:MAG: pantoate--beta-alanine ligase [Flavobacteriales bacterium]|nr:pantoate--beta-alanine ligase [Flavobacteriales bacterium]
MSTLQLIHKKDELKSILSALKSKGKTIGFVPTMGALHKGHKALVDKASSENDLVVVSIFVNPTQFNNKEDLALYPRTLDADLALLQTIENGIVFVPNVQDIYPEKTSFKPFDLGILDKVMEGKHRPGHFDGVVHVVHNLFEIVEPTKAYFGQKDFQQLAVIRKMNAHYEFPIEIIACETLREASGLAMSSRNMRLSEQEKKDALIIWDTLQFVKKNKAIYSPQDLVRKALSYFETGKLVLEYLEIVDVESLQNSEDWNSQSVCCIAAYCGKVRLIDNLLL